MSTNEDSPFDVWFASLPEGRQKILREDKWLLAEAAFEAGKQMATDQMEKLISFHYIAKRDTDGTNWGGSYYNGSRSDLFRHAEVISRAFRAKSIDVLKEDLCQMLCDGPSWSERQASGNYTIMKVVKNQIVATVETDFCPYEHRLANPSERSLKGLRTDPPRYHR